MVYSKLEHRPSREELVDLYETKQLPMCRIATGLGVSHGTVRAWLKAYEIPTRTMSDTIRNRHKQLPESSRFVKGQQSPHWKGGRYVDRGYVRLYDPNHRLANKMGYVLEHHKVWESIHGEIPPGSHIHHVNGIKDDNRIENLRCMASKDHIRYISSQQETIRSLEARIAELESLL